MNPGWVVRSLMLLSWRSQLQRHRKHAQLTQQSHSESKILDKAWDTEQAFTLNKMRLFHPDFIQKAKMSLCALDQVTLVLSG